MGQGVAEKVLGKSLPFSMEAERAVLGALLLNDQRMEEVAELIGPQDFYVPAHRLIYQCMLALSRQQHRVDLITLQHELEKDQVLMRCGGVAYLVALQEDIPALGLLEQHARVVREKSVLRQLIDSASTIISNCYAQNDKVLEAVIDEAEKTIFQISAKRSCQSFMQLNIWLKRAFNTLSQMNVHSSGITGVASGLVTLDQFTSGFQKSDFVVVAARPSMGKTALALSLANTAARAGAVVGFFSLEMSAEQLTMRLLSGESGLAHQKIRNSTMSSDEWILLTHVAAQLANRSLFIDDTPGQSIMDVRAKARRLKQERGLDLLVIDYLQLINGSYRYENRHQEVSDISRSLKALAKELNIPVIALSQLSRAVDGRVDKRPMLSDLRESGAIEQDADVIMFLYRDIVYNPQTERPDLTELIIGKQRNGPTGTVYLTYRRELTRFEECPDQPTGG